MLDVCACSTFYFILSEKYLSLSLVRARFLSLSLVQNFSFVVLEDGRRRILLMALRAESPQTVLVFFGTGRTFSLMLLDTALFLGI